MQIAGAKALLAHKINSASDDVVRVLEGIGSPKCREMAPAEICALSELVFEDRDSGVAACCTATLGQLQVRITFLFNP